MTEESVSPGAGDLATLPRSERFDALEEIVVSQFKAALMMTSDEQLPIDESFFDLGLTSLLVSDVKIRLENMLGVAISANVLFNSPTVERLLNYLVTEPLGHLFAPAPVKN